MSTIPILSPNLHTRAFPGLLACSLAWRYGCAVVSTLLMALLRLGLNPWLGFRASFGLFFLSIIFTSWVAGIGPGILSIGLGLILGLNFFTASRPFVLRDSAEWVGLSLFVFVNFLIVVLNEKQRRAKAEVEANVQALSEKQALLEQHQAQLQALNVRLQRAMQETHHRVKNNLQVVAALTEIQGEPEERTVSITAIERIRIHVQALAMIHDLLTHEARQSLDADALHVKAILDRLIPLMQIMAGPRQIHATADDFLVTARHAAALALLVNELVSNALKHGEGDIEIRLCRATEWACLEVRDQGPGFPPDFDPLLRAHTGLELIESIGRWDLQGQVIYETGFQAGACIRVTFPLQPPTAAVVTERVSEAQEPLEPVVARRQDR